MDHASNPAILGAMLGACVGLVQYLIAMRVMARLLAQEIAAGSPGTGAATARVSKLKLTLLAKSFLVLPAIGYLAGSALGH